MAPYTMEQTKTRWMTRTTRRKATDTTIGKCADQWVMLDADQLNIGPGLEVAEWINREEMAYRRHAAWTKVGQADFQ